MFFSSHCCQSPFARWESQSTSPPWDALQHCAGLWTCCGGSSDSNLVLLLCVVASMCPAIRTSASSLVGALSDLYIFHSHRVCLVDPVDLICLLVGGFGSSSLATAFLGFNCGFISTSACGLSTEACSWGCPGGLGFALVRARCGGGAAAWVAGVLAAPGAQGSLWPGQQEL